MFFHECTRRAIDLPRRPANWTATLGSTTGHHHWPALLSTGQQHWPPQLVRTTGRHHRPGPLATCSKHVDDDDDDDNDDHDDDDDDDDDGCEDPGKSDGDGEDELTIHSNMCVHECALRAINLPSWPANWTATLGSTTGHHHWPA